jgi:hypothetical protein
MNDQKRKVKGSPRRIFKRATFFKGSRLKIRIGEANINVTQVKNISKALGRGNLFPGEGGPWGGGCGFKP